MNEGQLIQLMSITDESTYDDGKCQPKISL